MRELIDEARAESGLHTEDKSPRTADLIRRLADALERSETEDGHYEGILAQIDAFAHAHFDATANPMPQGSNFGEGALCLKEELARLRAENERLRRERDRLFAYACEHLETSVILTMTAMASGPDPTYVDVALAAHDREQENHRA